MGIVWPVKGEAQAKILSLVLSTPPLLAKMRLDAVMVKYEVLVKGKKGFENIH